MPWWNSSPILYYLEVSAFNLSLTDLFNLKRTVLCAGDVQNFSSPPKRDTPDFSETSTILNVPKFVEKLS